MAGRRVGYLLLLAGAVVFRIFYTGWLAGLFLPFVALLPLLGVVVSLPAALSCRLSLSAPERTARGEAARWTLTVKSRLGLPLSRVRVTVESVNAMTGAITAEKQTWSLPGSGAQIQLPAPTDHCGLLTARIASAWAVDCLGLFLLPLRRGTGAQFWVEPVVRRDALPPLPQEETPGVRPRPGGGPGEDYDPRAYRPGDPLNSIHWKLSAKRDELVTRETLETVRPLPLLTFDCFGAPDALDAVLDRLAGVSGALLAEGRPHAVAWAEPISGEPLRFSIAAKGDWQACLEAILSRPAPPVGRSILDSRQLGSTLHLTGGEAP